MDSLGSLNWDTCSVIENSLTLFALAAASISVIRSEEHTSELQSRSDLVCRLLLEKKKKQVHRRGWAEGLRLYIERQVQMHHTRRAGGCLQSGPAREECRGPTCDATAARVFRAGCA